MTVKSDLLAALATYNAALAAYNADYDRLYDLANPPPITTPPSPAKLLMLDPVNGSLTGTGKPGSPFKTAEQAAAALFSGATLQVVGGADKVRGLLKLTSSLQDIVIEGIGSDKPVLSGANVIGSWTNAGSKLWQTTLAVDPGMVIISGKVGNRKPLPAAEGDWSWAGGFLTVYASANPQALYGANGIEAAVRYSCIDTNGATNVVIRNIIAEGCGPNAGEEGNALYIQRGNAEVSDSEFRLNWRAGIMLYSGKGQTKPSISLSRSVLRDNGLWGLDHERDSSDVYAANLIDIDLVTVHDNGFRNDGKFSGGIYGAFRKVEDTVLYHNGWATVGLSNQCHNLYGADKSGPVILDGVVSSDAPNGYGIQLKSDATVDDCQSFNNGIGGLTFGNCSLKATGIIRHLLSHHNGKYGVDMGHYDKKMTGQIFVEVYDSTLADNGQSGVHVGDVIDSLKVQNSIISQPVGTLLYDIVKLPLALSIDDNAVNAPATGNVINAAGNKTWAAWKASGRDTRSVMADPLFVDPANGDFSLKAASPALGKGAL